MPLTETSICQGCWASLRMPIPIGGPLAFPLCPAVSETEQEPATGAVLDA